MLFIAPPSLALLSFHRDVMNVHVNPGSKTGRSEDDREVTHYASVTNTAVCEIVSKYCSKYNKKNVCTG